MFYFSSNGCNFVIDWTFPTISTLSYNSVFGLNFSPRFISIAAAILCGGGAECMCMCVCVCHPEKAGRACVHLDFGTGFSSMDLLSLGPTDLWSGTAFSSMGMEPHTSDMAQQWLLHGFSSGQRDRCPLLAI
jgi:hypothetical protein